MILRVVLLACFVCMVYSSTSQEPFISYIERAASQPLSKEPQYPYSKEFEEDDSNYVIYDSFEDDDSSHAIYDSHQSIDSELVKAIHDDVRSLEIKVDSLVAQVGEINKLLKKVYELTTYSLYI